ncbi:hypothetical protein CBL_06025 [Carabus blaptoides fortunei]
MVLSYFLLLCIIITMVTARPADKENDVEDLETADSYNYGYYYPTSYYYGEYYPYNYGHLYGYGYPNYNYGYVVHGYPFLYK